MRKRIGVILLCTGIILLIKPNFDFDQIMMTFNYCVVHYWPLGFICVGVMLLWPPPKKSNHRKSRT